MNLSRSAQNGTDTVDSVHAAFSAWFDRQYTPSLRTAGWPVLLGLWAIKNNGAIADLVRGLDEHVKQLEAAMRAGQ